MGRLLTSPKVFRGMVLKMRDLCTWRERRRLKWNGIEISWDMKREDSCLKSQHQRLDSWKDECYPDQAYTVYWFSLPIPSHFLSISFTSSLSLCAYLLFNNFLIFFLAVFQKVNIYWDYWRENIGNMGFCTRFPYFLQDHSAEHFWRCQ